MPPGRVQGKSAWLVPDGRGRGFHTHETDLVLEVVAVHAAVTVAQPHPGGGAARNGTELVPYWHQTVPPGVAESDEIALSFQLQ